jgi:hypothetical protein
MYIQSTLPLVMRMALGLPVSLIVTRQRRGFLPFNI